MARAYNHGAVVLAWLLGGRLIVTICSVAAAREPRKSGACGVDVRRNDDPLLHSGIRPFATRLGLARGRPAFWPASAHVRRSRPTAPAGNLLQAPTVPRCTPTGRHLRTVAARRRRGDALLRHGRGRLYRRIGAAGGTTAGVVVLFPSLAGSRCLTCRRAACTANAGTKRFAATPGPLRQTTKYCRAYNGTYQTLRSMLHCCFCFLDPSNPAAPATAFQAMQCQACRLPAAGTLPLALPRVRPAAQCTGSNA